MSRARAAYLRRRALRGPWSLEGTVLPGARVAVVLPALGEGALLPRTLASLLPGGAPAQAVVVVNNRPPGHADPARAEDNRETLDALRAGRLACPGAALAWVDAASPGREIPPGEGVGTARRIGLDLALEILDDTDGAVLACLDGDSPAAPGYLDALAAFGEAPGAWAGWCDFEHPLDAPAMAAYELHIRCYARGLRWAGSPYAFPAIGSTMACTAAAYAAAGGMNRREAGEDFYFLQQLAKTGTVRPVPGARVFPSARASDRVPFGTGAKLSQWRGDPDLIRTYNPRVYAVLREWLGTARAAAEAGAPAEDWMRAAAAVHPALPAFLEAARFPAAWERLRAGAPTPRHRLRAFHEWFDGLRTLRAVHHLRGAGLESLPVPGAAARLAELLGLFTRADGEDAAALLLRYREADRREPCACGLSLLGETAESPGRPETAA
ncbi:MAG TPA: glycosyltransferase family A protein [Candidatus Hydrogenedentes bacterium]|nr:glycosyltransferase family A protein [Candidatus Hydrogenedentota bacterium]